MQPHDITSAASLLAVIAVKEPRPLQRVIRKIELVPIEPPLRGDFLTLDLLGEDEIGKFLIFFIKNFPIAENSLKLLNRITHESTNCRFSIRFPNPPGMGAQSLE